MHSILISIGDVAVQRLPKPSLWTSLGFVYLLGLLTEENQTVQTIEASLCSPLQGKSWLASCWLGPSRKHAREPVWVQVQERDRRHDLRAEADTGEMQWTEHGYICSFRRPDQGLWFFQQWCTVENSGAPWLSPKISQHPLPAPWRSARPVEAQWVSDGQPPNL